MGIELAWPNCIKKKKKIERNLHGLDAEIFLWVLFFGGSVNNNSVNLVLGML